MAKECAVCGNAVENGKIVCPVCGRGNFRATSEYIKSLDGIFVSYSRKDHSKVKMLVNALRSQNVRVWIDDGEIRGGEDFEKRIYEGLEGAVRVIVFWSRASLQSPWVMREAQFALRRGKILPVLLEKIELPEGFQKLHTVDLSNWDGSETHPHFNNLINDVSFYLSLAGK